VASGWAVNEIMRTLAGKYIYAGIQVNSSGARVAIFKTKYETDFYDTMADLLPTPQLKKGGLGLAQRPTVGVVGAL